MLSNGRFSGVRRWLGEAHWRRIVNARVLVVGAGGIGCELLKALVLSGFTRMHVIDLDTIDVSNLNRQFLFRRRHVGMSKSEVAVQTVRQYLGGESKQGSVKKRRVGADGRTVSVNHASSSSALSDSAQPIVDITSAVGNITDPEYDIRFFAGFSIVFGALDNVGARQHVNRMCLAANVPFVESGTAGLAGYACVHVPNRSSCYECHGVNTKQKTFPACTIRNIPTKFIHCVVWAKYLFGTLFGPPEEEEEQIDVDSDAPSRGNVIQDQRVEVPTADPSGLTSEQVNGFVTTVFQRFFTEHPQQMKSMVSKLSKEPYPVDTPDWMHTSTFVPINSLSSDSKTVSAGGHEGVFDVMSCPTLEQSIALFRRCVVDVLTRRLSSIGTLTFDKDDPVAMLFVAACANIRAHNFHIRGGARSIFNIKGIAGNIITAVASTNAVAASLQVWNAVMLLASQGNQSTLEAGVSKFESGEGWKRCKEFNISTSGPRMILSSRLEAPVKSCMICGGTGPAYVLRCNTDSFTVRSLYQKVLLRAAEGLTAPQGFGFVDTSVDCAAAENFLGGWEDVCYAVETPEDSADGDESGGSKDTEAKSAKQMLYCDLPLAKARISHGSLLSIEGEFSDKAVTEHKLGDAEVQLSLKVENTDDFEDQAYSIVCVRPLPVPAATNLDSSKVGKKRGRSET